MNRGSNLARILRESSPYELTSVAGRDIYVKRMDKINYKGLSGNKVYKLLELAQRDPFPRHTASMGGSQGNLMLALAKLLSYQRHSQEVECSATYFTRAIPQNLKATPRGNFAEAIRLGLKIVEVSEKDYLSLFDMPSSDLSALQAMFPCEVLPYWIPQGGALETALGGVSFLADDLVDFIVSQSQRNLNARRNWKIATCSGTGVTAVALATCIERQKSDWTSAAASIEVLAIPCAMKRDQLLKSFADMLAAYSSSERINSYFSESNIAMPIVLDTKCKWIPFGKINRELYQVSEYMLAETGIEFDMIYAPAAWRQLLWHWEHNAGAQNLDDIFIYLHCGGQEGNASQLNRYKRKWKDLVYVNNI